MPSGKKGRSMNYEGGINEKQELRIKRTIRCWLILSDWEPKVLGDTNYRERKE
jgi:hypothetical protein